MRRIGILMLALCAIGAPALAQDDDEAAFDEALRNFGLAAGAAWQCTEEGGRDQIDAQALKAYNGIVRLFGSDRAFGFAAAFGAGAALDVATDDRAASIAAFEDGMASAMAAGADQ